MSRPDFRTQAKEIVVNLYLGEHYSQKEPSWRNQLENPAVASALESLLALHNTALQQAEANAVAWTISEIDKIHMGDVGVDIDRAYNSMKNKLRERYKASTGIDPVPSYPATLRNGGKG